MVVKYNHRRSWQWCPRSYDALTSSGPPGWAAESELGGGLPALRATKSVVLTHEGCVIVTDQIQNGGQREYIGVPV